MKAIDELKELIADEEAVSERVPINTEIYIESELAYRLIKEWPSVERTDSMKSLRGQAIEGLAKVYAYLEQGP